MQKLCNRPAAISLLALAAFLTPSVRAHVPACGAVIGTSGTDTPFVFTLEGDMGPCPADGLILNSRFVTVNLNGRSIRGAPGNTGVGIRSEYAVNTVILGPGRIENFGIGVKLGNMGQHFATVQTVAFANNRDIGVYIRFGGASGDVHIRQNTITGGGTGIRAAESSNLKLKENTITGQTVAGIALVGVNKVTVINNTLTQNYEGLTGDSIHLGFSNVRIVLNRFDNNTTNGLRLGGSFVASTNEFVGNTASSNGRDGFVLPSRGGRTEDNIATFNGRYGFFIEGENHRVIENKASGNTSGDLLFNPSGALGNCFAYNQFGTSNVAVLPACL